MNFILPAPSITSNDRSNGRKDYYCNKRQEALQAIVNASAQIFTWLEIRHVLAGQLHRIAGLGVAAHAGCTVVEGKTAKAADLYALVAHQC